MLVDNLDQDHHLIVRSLLDLKVEIEDGGKVVLVLDVAPSVVSVVAVLVLRVVRVLNVIRDGYAAKLLKTLVRER